MLQRQPNEANTLTYSTVRAPRTQGVIVESPQRVLSEQRSDRRDDGLFGLFGAFRRDSDDTAD